MFRVARCVLRVAGTLIADCGFWISDWKAGRIAPKAERQETESNTIKGLSEPTSPKWPKATTAESDTKNLQSSFFNIQFPG